VSASTSKSRQSTRACTLYPVRIFQRQYNHNQKRKDGEEMQDKIFREPNDEASLKQRRVCIAKLLAQFEEFFPAKIKTNWERRYFSSLTSPRRMQPLALDQATGTDREQPDPVQESCERNAFDEAFDIYMRRRSGEIEALIRADEKLDRDWLAEMRRKADKLAGIIRLETWKPQPVSINAPVEVIARDRLRKDKLAGLPIDLELRALGRNKKSR